MLSCGWVCSVLSQRLASPGNIAAMARMEAEIRPVNHVLLDHSRQKLVCPALFIETAFVTCICTAQAPMGALAPCVPPVCNYSTHLCACVHVDTYLGRYLIRRNRREETDVNSITFKSASTYSILTATCAHNIRPHADSLSRPYVYERSFYM